MLPRLRAGETLARATAAMAGAGNMRGRDARAYFASLQRAIDGSSAPRSRQPPSPAALAAFGVAVVEVPSRASQTRQTQASSPAETSSAAGGENG